MVIQLRLAAFVQFGEFKVMKTGGVLTSCFISIKPYNYYIKTNYGAFNILFINKLYYFQHNTDYKSKNILHFVSPTPENNGLRFVFFIKEQQGFSNQ